MKPKNKIKGKLMEYVCSETSVAVIENDCFEVLRNKIRVTLGGFYDDLSKKYIPIGVTSNDINLPNGTLIDSIN